MIQWCHHMSLYVTICLVDLYKNKNRWGDVLYVIAETLTNLLFNDTENIIILTI